MYESGLRATVSLQVIEDPATGHVVGSMTDVNAVAPGIPVVALAAYLTVTPIEPEFAGRYCDERDCVFTEPALASVKTKTAPVFTLEATGFEIDGGFALDATGNAEVFADEHPTSDARPMAKTIFSIFLMLVHRYRRCGHRDRKHRCFTGGINDVDNARSVEVRSNGERPIAHRRDRRRFETVACRGPGSSIIRLTDSNTLRILRTHSGEG